MSHIYHPELGDPARPAILVDGCSRCEEHADHLYTLDGRFIYALWQKMLEVERNDNGGRYRSHAEVKACTQLWTFALLLERYSWITPLDSVFKQSLSRK